MSNENTKRGVECDYGCVGVERLRNEFQHLKSNWGWLFLLGVLLAVCGTAAIICPALTVFTTFTMMIIVGIALMVSGVAMIVAAFWAGRWSGMLLQLLTGVLYLVLGFMVSQRPEQTAMIATAVVASLCIVMGGFRILASLAVRFPSWGWSLLNGTITFLFGLILLRHFAQTWPWVIGLLVGVELLFNGWTWITLSLAIRALPDKAE